MGEFEGGRTSDVESDAPVPEGLLDAFWRYEQALMADDVPTLDALFADGPHTMRGDAGGLLVGHDAISAFRRGRGGAPKRRVLAVRIRVVTASDALVVAVLEPLGGGRGQQTQLWHRGDAGWQITTAHVSGPTPAVDPRIWRVVGTPLVEGEPLPPTPDGERGFGSLWLEGVAVKDLFAIAGQRIGGGVPAYLAGAPVETSTAPAVQQLVAAGAQITGIAQTDEFAYSIAGANPHYGTPPNAAVPGGLPGGSSSGPATAVALGHTSIGLATDTAGSIRVPASYQGLWGLRTTHGSVPSEGLLPLAPTFDTVGWLTRDLATLVRVANVAFEYSPRERVARRIAIAPALIETLDAPVAAAFRAGLERLPGPIDDVDLGDVDGAFEAFRTVQAFEAWQSNGAWLTAHPDSVSGAVAERFAAASTVTEESAAGARRVLAQHRSRLRAMLQGVTLALPSAASVAPQTTATAADVDRIRMQTLRLTCIAGIAGAPALSVPVLDVDGAPLGLCLVGAPGSDIDLLLWSHHLLAPRGAPSKSDEA